MKRVLIVCTGNSCRSQMGEAIWRHAAPGEWETYSAGTDPQPQVHPLALQVLEELRIDAGGLAPQSLDSFEGQHFDVVLTVCDSAVESCPGFPGAPELLHWSFEDPAVVTGSDEECLTAFRQIRDEIRTAIAEYLRPRGARFASWMRQMIATIPGAEGRAADYEALVEATAPHVESGSIWSELPSILREHFLERGWEWNGIYTLDGDRLHLAHAAGPPVCSELRRKGGVGTSGMCFDAVLMNQTLFAPDVSAWPGYVSCDGHSGLATASGVAAPIRGADGEPIAVWDLDSTAEIPAEDVRFLDHFFATLSAVLRPELDEILTRPTPAMATASHSANGSAPNRSTSSNGAPPAQTNGTGHPERDERPVIRLDQFLKWCGWAATGGQAKIAIQAGEVKVGGAVETRRGRRLRVGDRVEFAGEECVVELAPPAS